MSKKVVRILSGIARVLKIAISIVVLFAIILQFAAIPTLFKVYVIGNDSMHSFHTFLENILTLAIGLEFFRMICYSDADAVLDVVMFVLAHHLLTNEGSALDGLLSVIGIAIVVLVNAFLKYFHKKMGVQEPEEEFHILK